MLNNYFLINLTKKVGPINLSLEKLKVQEKTSDELKGTAWIKRHGNKFYGSKCIPTMISKLTYWKYEDLYCSISYLHSVLWLSNSLVSTTSSEHFSSDKLLLCITSLTILVSNLRDSQSEVIQKHISITGWCEAWKKRNKMKMYNKLSRIESNVLGQIWDTMFISECYTVKRTLSKQCISRQGQPRWCLETISSGEWENCEC